MGDLIFLCDFKLKGMCVIAQFLEFEVAKLRKPGGIFLRRQLEVNYGCTKLKPNYIYLIIIESEIWEDHVTGAKVSRGPSAIT
jgi:hypothetical protein